MDLRGLSDHSIRSFGALQSAIYPLGFVAILAVAPLAFCQQGTIMGAVVDSGGAFIARAQVKFSLDNGGPNQETQSAHAGEFSFSNVPPGPFHLSFSAEGFALKTIAGELHAGETLNLPKTALAVASVTTEVKVTQTQAEIAETKIKVEEQQRIIGIIPNYFVTYNSDAAPLNTKQKFDLTWKTVLDPTAFVGNGITAGIWQAQNTYKGFGQGTQGYAKRYGASYATFGTGLVIGGVITPTIFKQDPRYFYKGTGTNALASSMPSADPSFAGATTSKPRSVTPASLVASGQDSSQIFTFQPLTATVT